MELMVKNVLSGSESFGSSGIDSLKWLHPLRPDDTVALRFEVLRSSKSPSGRTGILLSKSELWNQNERLIFTMQGTTLFDVTKK
jgi:acyl dehydratase